MKAVSTLRELQRHVGVLEFLYPRRSLEFLCSKRFASGDCRSVAETKPKPRRINMKLGDEVMDGRLDVPMRAYKEKLQVKKRTKKNMMEQVVVIVRAIRESQNGNVESWRRVWDILNRLFPNMSEKERRQFTKDVHMLDLDKPDQEYGSRILHLVRRHGYDQADLKHWIDCCEAPTVKEACRIMDGRKWPVFLLKFVLKRRCESRTGAYELCLVFQEQFRHLASSDDQLETFRDLLATLMRHETDFIPLIVRLIVDQMHSELHTDSVLNQLLWNLSGFGTRWHTRDANNLSAAQRILVHYMTQHDIKIDTKGYLALAFTLKDLAPDRSRAFVNVVAAHHYEQSNDETLALNNEKPNELHYRAAWPYLEALDCMKLLLAETEHEAMETLHRVLIESDTKRHSSMIWTAFITRMAEFGVVDDQLKFESLWNKCVAEGVELTPMLVKRLLSTSATVNPADRLKMFEFARKHGCKFDRSLNETYYDLKTFYKTRDWSTQIFDRLDKTNSTFNIRLRHDLQYSRSSMWDTYQAMLACNLDPDRETLKTLMVGAAKPLLKWGSLYASQRAVVEFKRWVRGAHVDMSDADDLLKLYPDPQLFHFYIRMLARAGYNEELLAVLPWMERIEMVPDLNCLISLIVYSPNGDFLMEHGKKSGNKRWNWPSQSQVDEYKLMWPL